MNEDNWRLIAGIVIAIVELTAITNYPLVAAIWDFIARVTGEIANVLARISVTARLHYLEVIQ